MDVADILAPDRIRFGVSASSKKKALEATAELLGTADGRISAQAIAEGLFARERLGSTGLGAGVALPHTRSSDARQAVGAFLTLAAPIDFDAADDQPVDLLFGLLVPEESTEEHLEILAALAEIFSKSHVRERLRSRLTARELLELLGQPIRPAGASA